MQAYRLEGYLWFVNGAFGLVEGLVLSARRIYQESLIKGPPKPYTLNLNPKPYTLNPKPKTLNPKPYTLNPKP